MRNTVDPKKLKKLDHTEPLKEKVYNTLLENIVDGKLAPGAQLVERSIAAWLGVSKSPVRDALHRLNGDGLVVSLPFRGFTVSPMSTREFIDLMQVRMAIELFCLEQKIDSYSDGDVGEFSETMERAGKFLEGGRDRLAHDQHLDFHCLLVRKFGNELMTGLYDINRKKLKRYLRTNVSQTPERIRISHQYHIRLLDAVKRRDKAAALLQLKGHFADIQQAYLERSEQGRG
ncbi:MAG: GntR family transcriptional regulator [Proteobacteria bacterium]|nr:GntR family transcriptional regulator [Pseudomonadota bacterium]